MSALILIIALILAAAAGYFFLQWKSPNRKEKLQKTMANLAETDEDLQDALTDLDNMTTTQINDAKRQIQETVKKVKELSKKKSDELSEPEQKAVANLTNLQEVQTILQEVKQPEDLSKKVCSYWDYGLAGIIAVGAFFISAYLFGKFFSIIKLEEK